VGVIVIVVIVVIVIVMIVVRGCVVMTVSHES
jgi:hypothetical protein